MRIIPIAFAFGVWEGLVRCFLFGNLHNHALLFLSLVLHP